MPFFYVVEYKYKGRFWGCGMSSTLKGAFEVVAYLSKNKARLGETSPHVWEFTPCWSDWRKDEVEYRIEERSQL